MRIAILDTYYPDAIRALPFDPQSNYETELRRVLDCAFGTADFYSKNLRLLGWDAIDIIANHRLLQRMWAEERPGPLHWPQAVLIAQIEAFQPDVLFFQDLSFLPAETLCALRERYLLAGQCSCAMPMRENVSQFDVVFTSFPFYVDELKRMGARRAEYLPLAFEPSMTPAETERDIDISFVGGVGVYSHWHRGTRLLEAVAAHFKVRFHWYGYGLENLATDSPLRRCYRGEAWGREMYSIYGRSKIVVNRHGEVARGIRNNLRKYEARGCGAMLVDIDDSTNPPAMIEFLLENDALRKELADEQQKDILAHHTYAQRMPVVSKTLMECLDRQLA